MTKYQYKVIVFLVKESVENWEKELNRLGKEGWELVEVIPMNAQLGFAGSTIQIRCFLKRKV